MAAASLLLAGGAGLLAALLVRPVRGARRLAALVALSGVALAIGFALLDGGRVASAALRAGGL